MALTPDNNTFLADETMAQSDVVQPSKTWLLDLNKRRVGGFIDDEQAIRQFVQKALMTARNRYAIYTDQYGNELHDLIGADVTDAFLNAEIPRMVREAIIYDDRIDDASCTFERKGDKLFIVVTFTLAVGGELTEEVVLNGV